ncbi:MAG: hypothetical protein RLZ25_2187 [Pseudomonadota bacterium]|jgi:hypothetical protein
MRIIKSAFHCTLIRGVLLLLLSPICHAESPIRPDPRLTPGAILSTDPDEICVPGYSKRVRNVSRETKELAYRLYGIMTRAPGEFEVDHLISLELGGSNAIQNLWPESFLTQPLNAHVKDELENTLHALVCDGKISLEEAQKAIATDWVQAYETYMGHRPGIATERPPKESAFGSQSTSTPVAACPDDTPIKLSKSGILHRPEDPNYSRTKPVRCFSTIEEGIAQGFRLPRN